VSFFLIWVKITENLRRNQYCFSGSSVFRVTGYRLRWREFCRRHPFGQCAFRWLRSRKGRIQMKWFLCR